MTADYKAKVKEIFPNVELVKFEGGFYCCDVSFLTSIARKRVLALYIEDEQEVWKIIYEKIEEDIIKLLKK